MRWIASATLFSGCAKRRKAYLLDKKEQVIVAKWEEKWHKETLRCSQNKMAVSETDWQVFFEWIKADFHFLDSSAKCNKYKNFIMKFLSLLFFFGSYAGFIYLYVNVLEIETFTLQPVILIIPSYLIGKWIDVKKYQETWSRCSILRARLLQEMAKYIYGLKPYDTADKNEQFLENILKLSDNNMVKFQDNMELKEKNMAVWKWKELLKD